MNEFFQKMLEIWNNFSSGKKTAIIASIAVLGLSILLVSFLSGQKNYKVLYSELDAKTASKVTSNLKESGIPYKLKNGGKTVLVPKEQVYQTRLNIAGENILDYEVGYEIFDETKLGMTDFVQKVNYSRALEGELIRTIESLKDVRQARVHLTMPEDKLFKEDQTEPKASVMIDIAGSRDLKGRKLEGVINLVAGSVDGLKRDRVFIVDNNGNYLSKKTNQAGVGGWGLTEQQLDMKKNIEDYLSRKAESMLGKVYGYNNIIVQVDASMDFSKIEKTTESYDPDSQVIRSEEISSKNCTNADGSTENQENSVTNYEINKTIKKFVDKNKASIEKLTVSAFLNGEYEKTDDGNREYTPLEQNEIAQAESIIKNAVGYQENRGDSISVENVAFRGREYREEPAKVTFNIKRVMLSHTKEFIVFFIILGLIIFALKSARSLSDYLTEEVFGVHIEKKRKKKKPQRVVEEEREEVKEKREEVLSKVTGFEEKELSEDDAEFIKKMEYVRDFSEENPQDAANIIKSWVQEG